MKNGDVNGLIQAIGNLPKDDPLNLFLYWRRILF